MTLSCLVPRGVSALAVTLWVSTLTGSTFAQFTPYGNSYEPHRAFGPQYSQYQSGSYSNGQPIMAGPQRAQQYAPPPHYGSRPTMAQPQYVAMSQQIPNLPTPPVTTEPVRPGPMQQPSNGYVPTQQGADYSQGGYESYSAGNGANGNSGTGYGCNGYGGYTPPSYGCCDVGYTCGPRRHWFGGVYGLMMERETCDRIPLAFYTPTPPVGYYPTDDEIVLTTDDLEHDVQGGAEVRFGATFGCCGGGGYGGGCDPCGCQGSCGCNGDYGCGTLGWEIGYWALTEDSVYASFVDGAAGRTYGMKSYQGLEFNYAGVWRPVNHAYDYAPPTEDHYTAWANVDVRVNSIQVRRDFSVQNVEWNLVCLPLAGGGCGASYDVCGGGASCDSCTGANGCCGGYSSGGHFGGGCGAYCYTGPRCQCSTSLGVRYFRFDEDFMFRSDFSRWQMPADTFLDSGYLAHYIETDNHLVGFQIGGNGCYHLGCCGRFAVHVSSSAGIYGNHIEKDEYWAGQVRYANGGLDTYDISAEDDGIAFLGELRLGASYQCTCNCRVYGGYRALGITGVALTTDQLTAPYMTPLQNSYIDCNGSLFLHGLQTGVEFMY